MSTEIRQPAVAGVFYSGSAEQLKAEISTCFTSPLGPGKLPEIGSGPRKLFGLVAPHAGYIYSGAGAAWAYAAAAGDGRPVAVVILGVNHHGVGAPMALSPAAGWRTPLGVMPVAQQLNDRLIELDEELKHDAYAHAMEHSLEVQVPFLQYTFGEVPIVPIVIGHITWPSIQRLGVAIA
ncbi:MAG: AmmeMemoRadiSam system protein B, partial [bacterium]